MVSVIIPVYNVLPYLKESLDSVTNQTYKNLEIIIVDDGSTDGSASVCDSYKTDSRVKVIHQENKGLSGARNAGLELATGEYIAFLDSDDAFLLNMIQTMVEGIERSKADIAVCGFDIVYSKKNMTESRFFKKRGFRIEKEETLSKDEAVIYLTRKVKTCVWNKLYRKELWDNLRFPEGRVFEDVWVLPDLLDKINRVHLISESLILYRQRPGSITSTVNEKIIEDKINSRKNLEEYINKYTFEEKENCYGLYEDITRQLTVCYSELFHIKGKNEYTETLKKELIEKWDFFDGKTIQKKSRITRFIFMHMTSFLYPSIVMFRALKRIF